MNKNSTFRTGIVALFFVILTIQSYGQQAAGCYTSGGKFMPCGSGPWTEYKDGVAYDVWCDCSKTPPYSFKQQSSPSSESSNGSGSDGTSASTYSEPSTSQADIERQQAADKARADIEKKQAFESGLNDLKNSLKGVASTSTPVYKTGTTTSSSTSLPLKVSGNSQSLALKTYDSTEKAEAERKKKDNELTEMARQLEIEANQLNKEADK